MIRNQIGMEYLDGVDHYLVEEIGSASYTDQDNTHRLVITKNAWTGNNMEIVATVEVKDGDYEPALKTLNDKLSAVNVTQQMTVKSIPSLVLAVTDGVLEVKKAEDAPIDVKPIKVK